MRLDQSSVEIGTFLEKISRGEIDLQPDFQRGQVWPEHKKRRLIDTILRQWYVPAIHIVVNDELDKEEVLDGQQRLRSILEFFDDQLRIDGTILPDDPTIKSLHGLFYSQLPTDVKSRFKRFTITTVRLREYEPEEPRELFFRLNQLTALTSAEQRNALVGAPRNQIRDLASELEAQFRGIDIGFSNARLNYDDTLARLAIAIETGSLDEKLTAAHLEQRYRSGSAFSSNTCRAIQNSIATLAGAAKISGARIKLNRATLFSWLFFASDYETTFATDSRHFSLFIEAFETARHAATPNVLPISYSPIRL
jgi:hypothetical protein